MVLQEFALVTLDLEVLIAALLFYHVKMIAVEMEFATPILVFVHAINFILA